MLHELHRTVAPRWVSVSISTAVWIVICRQPTMWAPDSGLDLPNSSRKAISPGISVSAIAISRRPQSASEISATLKSVNAGILGSPRSRRCRGKSRKIYTYLYIVNRSIGSRQGTPGAIAKLSCSTSVNGDRDRSTAVQRLEERMQRFQHLGGLASIVLSSLGLLACYPSPPNYVPWPT